MNYLLPIIFSVAVLTTPTPKVEEVEKPKIEITRQQDTYLKALQYCESGGRVNVRIVDSNNKHSTGVLQFQNATFKAKGIQYGVLPKDITNEEVEKLVFNPETQELIAHYILQNEPKGESNWYNCTKKLGQYPLTKKPNIVN